MRRRDLIVLLGSAMTAARALHAQQKAMPVIGFLSSASPGPFAPFVAAFRQGLSESGYVEGQNVAIEYRWAEGHYDRLPDLAADLVHSRVEVIATSGGDTVAGAAKGAAPVIPIVFTSGGDPVARGFVASLSRPGGNMTGVALLVVELVPKRLELVRELVPNAAGIGALINPKNTNAGRNLTALQEAARVKGVQLHIVEASAESDFEKAFASLASLQAGALVVGADPFFTARRAQIVALAAQHSLPTIYEWREFVDAGGLISYGPSLAGVYRQIGTYVGRILDGKKPADLPVEQPTKFELVINLNTAKALGLTIPQIILARADELIE
jgi:putative tryptophan/tyrosine transport system substrate-binding protein